MAAATAGQAPPSGLGAATEDVAATHPFTCNTCQVAFRNSEAQRGHMRSDWHRYNLKRRVASLPPLSSEIFAEKVITAQATSTAAAAKASFEKTCQACQRTYYSENAFQNHISSQKHKVREATWKKNGSMTDETGSVMSAPFSLGEPVNTSGQTEKDAEADAHISEVVDGLQDTSIEDHRVPRSKTAATNGKQQEKSSQEAQDGEDAKEEYPVSRCLFCNYDSPDLRLNVYHMSKFHGMFLPEKEYLVDLVGLIRYFHAKISVNNECLYCHTIKTTMPGIQTHMRDKGHCMVAFDTDEEMVEVGQFYDFTSTYSDDEDEEDEEDEDEDGLETENAKNGGVKVSKPAGADEDGWETDSSASSLDTDELCAVPLDDRSHRYSKLPGHRHHSNGRRPHREADGFHSHAHEHSHAAFYSDYELHLPSGRTAGHRSLAKYYRQNLHNHPTAEERMSRQLAIQQGTAEADEYEDGDEAAKNKNRALTTRANGMLGATDQQKREVRGAEKRERNRERRARAQYEWGVNKRGNFQKHYRDHLLQ